MRQNDMQTKYFKYLSNFQGWKKCWKKTLRNNRSHFLVHAEESDAWISKDTKKKSSQQEEYWTDEYGSTKKNFRELER